MRGKPVWLDFFFLIHILHLPLHFEYSAIVWGHLQWNVSVSNADEPLPFYEVLVGVLSARHHYELRQAIRETWLGYLRHHPHFQHRSAGWTFNFTAFLFVLICIAFLFLTMSNSYTREKERRDEASSSWQQITDSLIKPFIFTWPAANIVLFHSSSLSISFSLSDPSTDKVWWPLSNPPVTMATQGG